MSLVVTGCATTAPVEVDADGQRSIEGRIVSIDTQPWTYDGNAVVVLDAGDRGRVAVQLPARWNLCKAPAVDVQSLAVGARARAVGAVGAEGELVVCERGSHRLTRVE